MADATTLSVVVLLVATNGDSWLPGVIEGLRRQTYPALDVLALDNASSDGSRALLEKAFGAERVVLLERRVGYGRALAAALKVASDRAIDADAFLLLHDDAALDPGAVEALVAALEGERVGVAGAKLLDWDDPELLQAAGFTTDRYGRVFPRVERGEIDHGQHDRVADVLSVSSAAMLVARPVVERIGLFDLRYVTLADDLDFCWRARLAGWRVVVAGAAAARHAAAGVRGARDAPPRGRIRYYRDRNVLATLAKNYSLPRLLALLPLTVALSIGAAAVLVATGRARVARQVLQALQWNVAHGASTLRARARAQAARSVDDGEITRLMVHGAPRLRGYVERTLETVVGDSIEAGEEDALDAPPPRVADRLRRHPLALGAVVLAVLYLVGSREILGAGQLAGTGMPRYPDGLGELFREYWSGWRSGGTGGAAPATPGLVLLGLLRALSFGSAWLAQRLLVLGLPAVALAGAWRLAGSLDLPPLARRSSAVVYALSPLALAAAGAGRLPDLVLVAAAPFLLVPLARAARLAPPGGWRSAAASVLGLAIAASVAPWTLAFVIGAGLLLALVLLAAGRADAAGPAAAAALGLAAGAGVLLLPWTVELFREGSPLGLGGAAPNAGMIDLLALRPEPLELLPLAFGFAGVAAALVGAALAVEARRHAAFVLAAAGGAALMLAWGVSRGAPWIAPRPGQPLVLTALAVSLLVGFGIEGIGSRLARRSFGMPHLVAALAAVAIVAQLGAGVAWLAAGSRPGIVAGEDLLPAFFAEEARTDGAYRVLWVTGAPGDVRFALTPPEGDTLRSYATRRAGAGAASLERVVASISSGATEAGGRLLAAFGVRYLLLRPGSSAGLADALERQGDLVFAQRFRGASLYRNEAWVPVAAAIRARRWVQVSGESLARLTAAEASARAGEGFAQLSPTHFRGTVPPGAPLLVLAQDFGASWRATVRGRPVEPVRSFGWATAFPLAVPEAGEGTAPQEEPQPQPAAVAWRGQLPHRLALAFQMLVLLGFAAAWSQRAARERGER